MAMPEQHFEEIRDACAHLHARGLLAAADGNVSLRLPDDSILLTPAGANKARLRPGSLARVTLDGRILEGKPSTERAMHLAVYRTCPDARVVVHAHPPTAIAWTLARPELTELPTEALPELLLAAGRVPIAPYARPGTEEMGTVLLPFLPAHRLLLLSRHGALAWGESMEEAINGIERVEHSALILKSAEELGGATPLPPLELEELRVLRARIGPRLL
jgi:L-fuculose-phosphate aldolase